MLPVKKTYVQACTDPANSTKLYGKKQGQCMNIKQQMSPSIQAYKRKHKRKLENEHKVKNTTKRVPIHSSKQSKYMTETTY